MFTGIIEDIGKIERIVRKRTNQILIKTVLPARAGDSIAVEGVCLTVIKVEKKGLWVETMPQTRAATTLDRIVIKTAVNLERAIVMGARIGGHLVLGHVDEMGKLVRKKLNEYFFQYNGRNHRYLVSKGSITVNGVSLTLAGFNKQVFSVNIIPYTHNNTTLAMLKIGDSTNIEYDYLVKIMNQGKEAL